MNGGTISNTNFVANSSSVIFDNINIVAYSTSANKASNTDGWDTYRYDSTTVQNSMIYNDDGMPLASLACLKVLKLEAHS